MGAALSASRTNRSRRDKRQKFTWLDQVKADDKLPSSAFLVAFQLMQGFNAGYGGACWKSIETLAEETGLSEPSIVRITRQLAQRGHLRIEPGKAGRGGHTTRYFLVLKTSADGGLQTSAQTSAGESQTSAGGGDSLKTHLKETLSEFPMGERERSRSLAVIPGAPAPDGGAPKVEWTATLYDVVTAYASQRQRRALKEEGNDLPALEKFATLLSIWKRPHGDE